MLALDITERYSELQLKLAESKVVQSAAALEAKRAIVRHIAHEVRGPLNTIAIAGDILAQELEAFPNVPKLVHEIVDSLKESSGTAMEQINEMMLFEKLSAGMRSIEPQAVPVLSYIRDCMKPHLVPALAKEIEFTLDVPTGAPHPDTPSRVAEHTCLMLDPVKVRSARNGPPAVSP